MYTLIYSPQAEADREALFDRADEIDPQAESEGNALGMRLALQVFAAMESLRRSPTADAEPTHPSHPDHGMLHRFGCDDPESGRRLLVTVLFRYMADEQRLLVLSLGADWLWAG